MVFIAPKPIWNNLPMSKFALSRLKKEINLDSARLWAVPHTTTRWRTETNKLYLLRTQPNKYEKTSSNVMLLFISNHINSNNTYEPAWKLHSVAMGEASVCTDMDGRTAGLKRLSLVFKCRVVVITAWCKICLKHLPILFNLTNGEKTRKKKLHLQWVIC